MEAVCGSCPLFEEPVEDDRLLDEPVFADASLWFVEPAFAASELDVVEAEP